MYGVAAAHCWFPSTCDTRCSVRLLDGDLAGRTFADFLTSLIPLPEVMLYLVVSCAMKRLNDERRLVMDSYEWVGRGTVS